MAKDEKRMKFGQRLRELREAEGISRKQLADTMGLSERAVIQWELGEREPGWFNVVALCSALGVNCSAFESDQAEPPPEEPARPRGRPRKAQTEPPPAKRKGKRK